MVIKQKPMGWALNIKQRQELIYIYERYIEDRDNDDGYFTKNACDFDQRLSGHTFYSKMVNFAMSAAWRMQEEMPPHKRMSIKEAKEILKKLEEEEEKEKK